MYDSRFKELSLSRLLENSIFVTEEDNLENNVLGRLQETKSKTAAPNFKKKALISGMITVLKNPTASLNGIVSEIILYIKIILPLK